MRLKYYLKLFGQMNVKKSFVFISAVILFIIFLSVYFIKNITPTITIACQTRAKAIGVQITEETVKECISNIKYDTLMDITYNDSGKILAISANIVELNKLSAEIAYEVQQKLNNLDKVTVRIPIGKLLGLNIFSGFGPSLNIKLVPLGNIETDYNTEFTSQGINQTRHTIYMNIKSDVTIVAPFIGSNASCNSTVTIAETIIVGDIPDTYYNIQGVEGAAEDGKYEVIN